jgi:hypothetical protein
VFFASSMSQAAPAHKGGLSNSPDCSAKFQINQKLVNLRYWPEHRLNLAQ